MSQRLEFPGGFWWGVAGAAHQIEGGNVNNDSWVLEHTPGSPFVESSGDACDHYHRYPQDIALIASLGFNTYRFSLEWSRIEPEEGEFSTAALEHYRRMLATCHEHGLTPILTYHHMSSPRWFAAKGGWEVLANADYFARYCERATAHLGDLIGAACTVNEPNLGLQLQLMGVMPPDSVLANAPFRAVAAKAVGSELFSAFPSCCQHQLARDTFLKAHRLAVNAIKSGKGDFPVGMALSIMDYQAVDGGEAVRDKAREETDVPFLEAARDDDFIGVQTYSRVRFGPNGMVNPDEGAELTQLFYEFYPEALEATIRYAASYTGKPVIVTENGIGTSDDSRRIEFIIRALHGVKRCLQDGIDVRGYCHWSLFDNFEWTLGYRPTFGLIAVDRVTQERRLKLSAKFLGEVARANGFEMSGN
ncbi:MAG: family 1 glycosylhydrolase [Burkholderiales bacterium]|nr:family 1 glycosylhydrolase [Anaerolineae bacterium]